MLGAPNAVGIQTLDHVVYLTGLVDTGQERALAEEVARGVPGVMRVVNSIGVRNEVRQRISEQVVIPADAGIHLDRTRSIEQQNG